MDRDEVCSSCLRVTESGLIKVDLIIVAILTIIFLLLVRAGYDMPNPADYEVLKVALLDFAIVITLSLAATLSMAAFKRPLHQFLAVMAVAIASGVVSYVRMDVPVSQVITSSGRVFNYNIFVWPLYALPLLTSLAYLDIAYYKWCIERNFKRATATA